MTQFIDLTADPVLGRLHAINRKHRLRSKHYAAIEDWPDEGATIDVLDADALTQLDHFPNSDGIFVVSSALLAVLRYLEADLVAHPVDAAGTTVYVIEPVDDDDVMYASEGHATYSESGYNVLDAINLRIDDPISSAFQEVRNCALLAISDELSDDAAAIGIRWTPLTEISHYTPFPHHPYQVLRGGHAAAYAESIEALGDWPDASPTPHPLGEAAVDAQLHEDPDELWAKLIHSSRTDNAAFARYCSELALPDFRAHLDPDIAKSKLKRRWKQTLAAGYLNMAGLPVVSGTVRDRLLAAGAEATFDQVELVDEGLGESHDDFWLMYPTIVVDWIDWAGSDVGLRRNGIHDEYFDLQPTARSFEETTPLIRVRGSNLVLVHESIGTLLTEEEGFFMTPLGELALSANLDDSIKAN